MAFSDFAYPGVMQAFGLSYRNSWDLFARSTEAVISPTLRKTLETNAPLALIVDTVLSRTAWMIAPLVSELWSLYRGRISVHAGAEFDADPDASLNGGCDFLIGTSPQLPRIVAPVTTIIMVNRGNPVDGIGPCIAAMVGALRFNHREGRPISTVYGAVTSGSEWRFLQLSGSIMTLDLVEYTISQVDRLLGILTYIVGPVPGVAAA